VDNLPTLSEEAKAKLEDLRVLSERAEDGDREARRELRAAVRASAPEVVACASDVGRRAQRMLVRTAAAGDPLIEEALEAKLDLMRYEIAGENPTPLEVLLTERVVSCWMLVELLEVLTSAQLRRGEAVKRVPVSYLLQMVRWQESANRRFLAAVRELAGGRKPIRPGVQIDAVEQQANVAEFDRLR
jgi:hypothetical protein